MDKKIRILIDETTFREAFDRDIDQEAYPATTYLDKKTGMVHWVYDSDEAAYIGCGIPESENRRARIKISNTKGRYLEIPGLSHGEHHDILKEFLDSDWTENQKTKKVIKGFYHGSIGAWKKDVSQDIWYTFADFKEKNIEQRMNSFLQGKGLEPEWN